MSDTQPPLILASTSPRRRRLLQEAGIEFEVMAADGPEPEKLPGESCSDFARRAAEWKAGSVALRFPGRLVLGADTVVALDGDALGKPADAAEAEAMLARLSGRTHCVYTAVAIAITDDDGRSRIISDVAATAVTFRNLTEAEISEYVATGEPLDKAGAYGIQGLGGRLVAGYEGCYTNVVGLPMETVAAMMQQVRETPVTYSMG
jgi:septum formation protein